MRTETRSRSFIRGFYPVGAALLLAGARRPSRVRAALLVACAAVSCTAPGEAVRDELLGGPDPAPAGAATAAAPAPVLAGVDVLLTDSLHVVRGRRVGLVTNHTGVSTRFAADGTPLPLPTGAGGAAATTSPEATSIVDVLHAHPEVELVALFTPEHGLSGTAEAGERVESGRHEATGLPIYSLYTADTRRPLPQQLEGVDVLLFDIQDVGARYYTYVYTMALAMEAAGQAGVPFVVLDRPNPIGGAHVQGNVLDTAFATFVGMYPVPMRHGMTPGELARLFRGEFGVEAELSVIPVAGWERGMWYDETTLPWTAPSPNMPSLESATHYPGTCLFEGTNLSVGRGTDRAFQWIGAPWLDGALLAERLNAYGLPGVRFEAATFTPQNPGDAKWSDTTVQGVRFVATDRTAYDPTRAAVAALIEARRMSGDRWSWNVAHIDRLAGTDALRLAIDAGAGLEEATAGWAEQVEAFSALREAYLIYR